MAGRTAGPIKTKLGIGTDVDPGSVLVKVKVIWRHLARAERIRARSAINTADRGLRQLRPEDGYLQLVYNNYKTNINSGLRKFIENLDYVSGSP